MSLFKRINLLLPISLLYLFNLQALNSRTFINIPNLGKIHLDQKINNDLLEKKLGFKISKNFTYSGNIQKTIEYKKISITNIEIIYSPTDQKILIIGDAKILGIPLCATLSSHKKGKYWTKQCFMGHANNILISSLFDNQSIAKSVGKSSIKKVIVKYNPKKKQFIFSGKTNLLGATVEVTFSKINYEEESGIVLKANIMPGWKFSDTIPILEKTFFDNLKYSNASFTISALAQKEEILGTEVKAGISLDAKIKLRAELEIIKKLISVGIDEIDLSGQLDLLDQEVYFVADLPGVIKFQNSPINSGGVKLRLNATPTPQIILMTYLKVKTPNDDEIKLSSQIGIGLEGISLAATMKGMWENALGIHGLDIGNLAIKTNTNYALLSEGIPITGLGLTGKVNIGKTEVPLAINLGLNPANTIIYGAINQISLKDLVRLTEKICGKIKNLKIPNIEFKDGKIYFSLAGGKIGEFEFPAGIALSGKATIMGKEGCLNFYLGKKSGLIAEGSLPTIEIGRHFKMTGKGLDNIAGTKDDGPAISLKITPLVQEFFLSGELNLLGMSKETQIHISKEGFQFKTNGKLLNLYDTELEALGHFPQKLSDPPSFSLDGKLNVLGKEGTIRISLDKNGVITEGRLPKIEIPSIIPGIGPIFQMTASDFDDFEDLNDGGPNLCLNLTSEKKELILGGNLNILGISKDSEIYINKDGYSLYLEDKLFNLFDVELIGSAKFPKKIFEFPNFNFTGKMNAFGKEGILNLSLSKDGIVGEGALPTLKIPSPIPGLPLFKMSGVGLDREDGTEDDGPILSIKLTPTEQEIFLDGEVNILGTSSRTNILISPDGELNFITYGKLKGLFSSKLIVNTPPPKKPIRNPIEWTKWIGKSKIEATLTNEFQKLLEEKVLIELEQEIENNPQILKSFPIYKNIESELELTKLSPFLIAQKILQKTPLIINKATLTEKLSQFVSIKGPNLKAEVSIFGKNITLNTNFSLINPPVAFAQLATTILKKLF